MMSWFAAEAAENLLVFCCVQKLHLCIFTTAHPELAAPRRLLTIQHSEPRYQGPSLPRRTSMTKGIARPDPLNPINPKP